MKEPEKVKLTQAEGEALIERIKANALTESDRGVLERLIHMYFWLQRGGGKPAGQGRQSAEAYTGAERVLCQLEALAVGQRCPACGQGSLYRLLCRATI